jgi:hypothetical protein
MPRNPPILLYRLVRSARALFSPSVKAYSSTIAKYLAPEYPFPAVMRLESYRCYYFLSSVCSALRPNENAGYKVALAGALFQLDCWLLRRISWLRKFCWFCSYRLTITKPEVRHGSVTIR